MQNKKSKTITLSIDYGAVGASLREVFSRPIYVILALVLTFAFLVIALLLPELNTLKFAFTTEYFDWSDKLAVMKEIISRFGQTYTLLQKFLIAIGVVSMSLNVSMLVYLVRKRAGIVKTSGVSLVGAAVGALGLGCGACGSAVLASFIGVTGAAGVLGSLPFKGAEFGVFSIGLILVSTYLIAKKINAPLVCPSKSSSTNERNIET